MVQNYKLMYSDCQPGTKERREIVHRLYASFGILVHDLVEALSSSAEVQNFHKGSVDSEKLRVWAGMPGTQHQL